MKISFAVIILSVLLFAGCAAPTYTVEMDPSGTKMLKGYFQRTDIEHDTLFTWFKSNYDSYAIDSASIEELKPLMRDVHFLVVLGTWCGDSKREFPHTTKIMDAAGISGNDIRYFGVDHSKKSTDGTTEKYNIMRVPTLIVFKGEEEVGRIVEHPRETQEKDLLRILRK
ncbi:MAG: thioredoxin family protein [Bacteroidota bacterium]